MDKKKKPVRNIRPTQQENRIGPNNPAGEVDPVRLAKQGRHKK